MKFVTLWFALARRASRRGVGWAVTGLWLVAGGEMLWADCLPRPDGVVGWWPGDGDANDVLGTNNGTLQGGATANTPGMVGEAFHFDGTNSFVAIPDSTVLQPTNLTIEAWVRFDDLDSEGTAAVGRQFIVFKQNRLNVSFSEGYDLSKVRVGNSDVFTFRITSATGKIVGVDATTSLTVGVWYHVACMRGPDFLKIYVNGRLENQTDVNFVLDYGTQPLFFGSSGQGLWDRKLKGALDEVTLYNRALSPNEVAAIYEAGAAGKCREVIITPPPIITNVPESQVVLVGAEVNFVVGAEGEPPLAYQWRKDDLPLSGETNATLTLSAVTVSAAGNYDVAVSNPAGSVTSVPPARLTVVPTPGFQPPQILAQPQSQTVGLGADVTFAVTVSGSPPLSFQWRKDGLSLAEATNAALSLSNATTNEIGSYDLVVANESGSVTSSLAKLSVKLIVDPELEKAMACALDLPPGQFGIVDLASLTNLSVRGRGITNLTGLEFATNLAALVLSENRISDLTSLRGLSRLTSLQLEGNRAAVTTLDPLAGLTKLTCLTLGQVYVESYAPLAGLTNLTSLSVSQGNVADPDFLTPLTRLTSLTLAQNNLTGLAPLMGLTNLTRLDLRWNRSIADYAPLTLGPTNLESLYLGGNAITNLASLQNLQHLSLLNLADNQIGTVPALGELPNLNYLVLSRNPITNYAPLAGLTNLAFLELAGNSISNVAFLAPMRRLRYVDLAYNQVTNLARLTHLENLEGLVLTGNPINSYAPLANLPGLSNLWLQGCSITNADFVKNQPWLRHLNLDDNPISDLTPVLALTNLTGLGVSHNLAADILSVAALTNLTSLRVEGDFLTDVSAFTNLVHLSFLSLNQNRLTNAAPLVALTNLHNHYLRQNRLRDISYLAQVPGLQEADLSYNLLDLTNGSEATALIDDLHCREPATSCSCDSSVGLAAGSGLKLSYSPQQAPPTISAPARWFLPVNTEATFSFTTTYDLLPDDPLTMTSDSSADEIVPDDNLVLGGKGNTRTVTITPATNQTGSTTLTLTVLNEAGLSGQANVAVEVLLPISVTNMFPSAESLEPAWEDALRQASGNNVGELTSADLLNATSLNVVESDMTGFTGWTWLTNLTSLYLEGETINDLTFLTNLTHLQTLAIADTVATDFLPVASLTNLTTLTLSGATVSNLSFLATCARLTMLNISQTRVTDLSPLIALTNLVSVTATRNSVTNILALVALPALTDADVRYNLLDLSADAPSAAVIASLLARELPVAYWPQRAPPEFQIATEWFVVAGQTSALPFDLSENGEQVRGLVSLSGDSADHFLLPDENLEVGPDPNSSLWTLAITPTADRSGIAVVTLTVTNDVGLVSNQAITVTISTPQSLNDRFFGMTDVALQTGGDAAWFGQNTVSLVGFPAAQSPGLADGETSILESELIGPGTLSFWWKVSSEADYDWLVFESALETHQISGEVDWQEDSVAIAPRAQTVRWYYAKDGDTAGGTDTAWLSRVTFVPATWLDLTGSPTNGQCQLNLYGVPGQAYELEFSTNLIDWESLATFACTNRITPVSCESGNDATRFYRARAIISSPRLFISAQFGNGFELSWPGLGVLQSAPTVDGPWETIGGSSPVYISTDFAPAQYFRIQVTDP